MIKPGTKEEKDLIVDIQVRLSFPLPARLAQA